MDKKILNIPNILTISRFVLSPVFFILLLADKVYEGLAVFVIVALTDLADGWVARSIKQKTAFGGVIDPMADKFMVFIAMIAIIIKFKFPLYGLFILVRDIVSLASSILVHSKNKGAWKPNIFGKLTTAFQVITIIAFIAQINFRFIILFFTIGLSFITAITYSIKFFRIARE